MKRLLPVLLAAMVISSTTVAWLGSPKTVLRVAWWGNPTRDARTLKVIEMYMAKNPHVLIQPETTAWSGYWDKIATQAAANILPDVIQQDYAYLFQYADKDLLLDLTPFVRAGKIDLTGVDDAHTAGGRIGGRYYGISLGTNALGVVYDPGILAKAGLPAPSPEWTWDDLAAMAVQIHERTGVQTLPFGTTDPKPIFEHWVRQTGKSFYDTSDGASLGFNDSRLLAEYFSLQLRLLEAGVLVRPETAFITKTVYEAEFTKGLSWLDFLWSNQLVMQANAHKGPVAFTLLPRIAGAKRPGTYLKPAMFFSVARSTAKADEAVKFIDYFLNDLEANQVLLAERGIPIVPRIRKALRSMIDPAGKQAFDFVDLAEKNASPLDPPDPPGSGEVLRLLRDALQEVLYGIKPPQDAAAQFMKQANGILAKNKKR